VAKRKAKRKPRPDEVCVFCSVRAADTMDHVPPAMLFTRPRPTDLLTVPACERCNNELSNDEDLVINYLLGRREAETPAAIRLREELFAKERTPRRVGTAEKMLSKLTEVEVLTPGGLVIGRELLIENDWQRFDRVVGKIARGLWFGEFAERLPPDRKLLVECQPELDGGVREAIRTIVEVGRGRAIGTDVFEYRVAKVPGTTDAAACVMLFLRAVLVTCSLVAPGWLPEEAKAETPSDQDPPVSL
jgi:hypothetical protein